MEAKILAETRVEELYSDIEKLNEMIGVSGRTAAKGLRKLRALLKEELENLQALI